MKQEEKLYYETLFEERKQELLELLNKYEIKHFNIRGNINNSFDNLSNKNTLDIYRSARTIYIEYKNETVFYFNLLKSTVAKDFYELLFGNQDVYELFCNFFERLINEINKGEN